MGNPRQGAVGPPGSTHRSPSVRPSAPHAWQPCTAALPSPSRCPFCGRSSACVSSAPASSAHASWARESSVLASSVQRSVPASPACERGQGSSACPKGQVSPACERGQVSSVHGMWGELSSARPWWVYASSAPPSSERIYFFTVLRRRPMASTAAPDRIGRRHRQRTRLQALQVLGLRRWQKKITRSGSVGSGVARCHVAGVTGTAVGRDVGTGVGKSGSDRPMEMPKSSASAMMACAITT